MSGHINPEKAYEALTTMVLAIHEDPELSDWFESLEHLSSVDRRNEVYRMREELAELGLSSSEEITSSMMFLSDDRVFKAARQAFHTL